MEPSEHKGHPKLLVAADTARANIPIQKSITKPEYWVGYVIVFCGNDYRVYKANAWEKPTGNLLPWSEPTGQPVADVSLEGELTYR